MAILASLTVIQCDHCPEIFIEKDDASEKEFNDTWFDGLIYQYCPDCKELDEIKPHLDFEAEAFESMTEAARQKINEQLKTTEVKEDVEFIN